VIDYLRFIRGCCTG